MDKHAKHLAVSGAALETCADTAGCETQQCEICLKEVPADALHVNDALDYVHHFCGLDCLETWRKRAKSSGIDPVKP